MSILALTSDTLIGTPATGNLEYNGQFFGTDSNASRAQLQRIVQVLLLLYQQVQALISQVCQRG
jgi:hypothetical protein